jgi:SOCS box
VLAGCKVKLQLIDHINGSEDKDLVSWLETESMTPPTLSRLCRTVIRRQLSAASGYRTILPLIDVLEIPIEMKMYLRFEGSFNEVDLKVSDNRTRCETCDSPVEDVGLYYSERFCRLPNSSTYEDADY